MVAIETILGNPVKYPFRKAEMKRRQISDGLYESSWQDITDYVTKWGILQRAIDDQRANHFVFSGLNLTVRSDWGEFDPEYEGNSLFHGYLTRYRTLIKITAGYTDGSGNQFPTDGTQGIYLLDNEIVFNPKTNESILNCKSLISPFQETRATEISGITATLTASDIVALIRDATDGSNNKLFSNFITTTAWNIQTTTNSLLGLNTTTVYENFSVWEFLQKLAEGEGFAVYIDRFGAFYFVDKIANTTSSQFSFYGDGYRNPNIIDIVNYKEAINKFYTNIRIKYLEDDTASSYIELGTSTVISPRSREWVYGRRTYEFENLFFGTAINANIAIGNVVREFGNLKSEMDATMVFTPHLELLDHVDVSHREGSINSIYLWDIMNWAADTTTSDTAPVLLWASETSATIEFTKKSFKIISIKTNLDNFTTSFRLRETEN